LVPGILSDLPEDRLVLRKGCCLHGAFPLHVLGEVPNKCAVMRSVPRLLAVITNRFNTLASALDTARDENSRLYQQLISVQEEEHREIANELHDEAGPCCSASRRMPPR
jgi:signal transduction histidine kinase